VDALDHVTSHLTGDRTMLWLELTTPVRRYPRTALSLAGRHQATNAIVAVRVLEALEAQGIRVGAAAVLQGLSDVHWPGRLEWIEVEGGALLLDAAHNPAGAQSLASYLAERAAPMPLVFGAVKGKDVHGMLEVLLPQVSRLIVTEPPTPRAQASEEIVREIRTLMPQLAVAVERDPIAAVRAALADGGRATVTGSIFLIGAVRGRLYSERS
jgi:dihydrofolate synthase/folylpolyglutamate synthase